MHRPYPAWKRARLCGVFGRRGETPLHSAAAYADEAIVGYLVEKDADKKARDAPGESPLSWAGSHLRPGSILALLAFGEHPIGAAHIQKNNSDHGHGWGNGMDWNLLGDFLPETGNQDR